MKRQNLKYFTNQQKERLLETIRNSENGIRDLTMFEVMFNTGLRLSELHNLDVGDVLDKAELRILGKGNKLRIIPLNRHVQHVLSNRYLKWKLFNEEDISKNAPLFLSRLGYRISYRAIQRALKRWLELSGLPSEFSPHSLRHSFCTSVYQATKNLRVVQDLAGHASIATTQIYTHVTHEEMVDACELIGGGDD